MCLVCGPQKTKKKKRKKKGKGKKGKRKKRKGSEGLTHSNTDEYQIIKMSERKKGVRARMTKGHKEMLEEICLFISLGPFVILAFVFFFFFSSPSTALLSIISD